MSDFPNRLRLLREEQKITQAELGQAIGLGRATINYYEAGKTLPDLDIAVSIANYFEVTLDYLCGKSEYRSPATYQVGMERAEEFVALMENSSETEAKDLLNKLTYLLLLTTDDNITPEILGTVNALLESLQEIVLAYRKARKGVTLLEEDDAELLPHIKRGMAVSYCEPIAGKTSTAKTEISGRLDALYSQLRVKITGIK